MVSEGSTERVIVLPVWVLHFRMLRSHYIKLKSGVVLNTVVGKTLVTFKFPTIERKPLLILWDAFRTLNLTLDVFNGVGGK